MILPFPVGEGTQAGRAPLLPAQRPLSWKKRDRVRCYNLAGMAAVSS
jgi:hypothetical protein